MVSLQSNKFDPEMAAHNVASLICEKYLQDFTKHDINSGKFDDEVVKFSDIYRKIYDKAYAKFIGNC